ncbi:tRNA (adenosine(37)-N6)-threonylcarbamoyltransferase complex ATPase subunit type 1 TsaE [Lysobacter xanthus]
MKRFLPDPEATDALGRALAVTRPRRAVVHLRGDLGAGKSSLARALLRELGVQGTIRSPTYTLVERYSLADGEALHLDLYRIGDPGELDYLGLEEADVALWLVEWPDRGRGRLPDADLVVDLQVEGNGRQAVLEPASPGGHAWIARLGDAFTSGDLHV